MKNKKNPHNFCLSPNKCELPQDKKTTIRGGVGGKVGGRKSKEAREKESRLLKQQDFLLFLSKLKK